MHFYHHHKYTDMSKTTTGIILLLLSVSLAGNGYLLFLKINSDNYIYDLEDQVIEINNQITTKDDQLEQTNYAKLQLESDPEDIQLELNDIMIENTKLDDKLTKIQKELNDTIDLIKIRDRQISKLNKINETYTNLNAGNSLTSFYDTLRHEEGLTGGGSQKNMNKEIKFGRDLVKHTLGKNIRATIEKEYRKDTGISSYTQAYEILKIAYNQTLITKGDSDTEKVEKILDYVNDLLDFESDLNDVFRAPAEVLTVRTGDCDDYCFLAAALFEEAEIETAIGFYEDSDEGGHVMLLLRLSDLEGYSYYSYDSLTSKGLSSGKWIQIEPQRYIDDQNDKEWMDNWKLRLAEEID